MASCAAPALSSAGTVAVSDLKERAEFKRQLSALLESLSRPPVPPFDGADPALTLNCHRPRAGAYDDDLLRVPWSDSSGSKMKSPSFAGSNSLTVKAELLLTSLLPAGIADETIQSRSFVSNLGLLRCARNDEFQIGAIGSVRMVRRTDAE